MFTGSGGTVSAGVTVAWDAQETNIVALINKTRINFFILSTLLIINPEMLCTLSAEIDSPHYITLTSLLPLERITCDFHFSSEIIGGQLHLPPH